MRYFFPVFCLSIMAVVAHRFKGEGQKKRIILIYLGVLLHRLVKIDQTVAGKAKQRC